MPLEFRLRQALAASVGRVFSRDQRIVTDRTVDSHVKNLRRKLDAALPDQQPIRSLYASATSSICSRSVGRAWPVRAPLR